MAANKKPLPIADRQGRQRGTDRCYCVVYESPIMYQRP